MSLLDGIRAAIAASRCRITRHGAVEMEDDEIDVPELLAATQMGEAIEDYPGAQPYPASLVLGYATAGRPADPCRVGLRRGFCTCYPDHDVHAGPGAVVAGLPVAREAMTGPDKCPLCGGAVDHDREVEELVRNGGDVAVVRVRADVCGDCGEAMFHPGMVERLSAARAALRDGNVAPASAIGRVYDLGSA